MSEIIKVIAEKCVGCNACIRTCPTSEANITKMLPDGSSVTVVNQEKCINCGECIRTCKHGARDYVDDTEAFLSDMKSQKTVLLVTPAIKTVFPTTWQEILKWFRQQGVSAIYDVSYGADICSWAHIRAIEKNKVKNVITQPCAAIVNYIEKYKPSLINNLSPIHSPISCEAVYLRNYLKVEVPMAVLSPCIAKKSEFEAVGIVKYNVTFKKLKEYFDKEGIRFNENKHDEFAFPFDDQQGLVGSIYPRPGGLRDNLWLHNPDLNITTSEGVHKVYPEIDMYAEMPEFKHPEVFDVLSCEFGCNTGPASGSEQSVFDIMSSMRDIEKFSKKKRKTGLFGAGMDKQHKKFDEVLNLNHFLRTYKPSQKVSEVIRIADLTDVFNSMGKYSDEDKHYDCHACGYKSCVDMATAIYRGLNVPDNCIVHAKLLLKAQHEALKSDHKQLTSIISRANSFSDNLLKDVECINNELTTINEINDITGEKAKRVQGLLSKLIEFCSNVEYMDSETLQQLISILQRVSKAFKSLDENVTKTTSSSFSIKDAVQQVTIMTAELNSTLNQIATRK